MLSKNFKSNKFYEVTRYVFRYGNEGDKMDASTTVWDSKEKAAAYIDKYANGTKFAKAYIEEVVVDRDITSSDYKNNRYNKIASQKIYLKNRTGVCKEPIEPIHFYTEPVYKNKAEDDKKIEEKVEPAEVFEIEDIRDGSVKTFDDLHDAYLNAWENANISEVWTYYKLYKRHGSEREFLKAVYPCTIVCGYEVVGATAGHGFFKTLQEAKDFLKEKGEKHQTTINKIVKEAPTDDSFIFAVDVYTPEEPAKEEKVYKVYGYARRFDSLDECEAFAEKVSKDEHRDVTILSEVIGTEPKTTEIEVIKYEAETNDEDEGVSIVPKFEVCVDGKPVTSTETIEGANIIKKALVAEARKHKARDKPPDTHCKRKAG